MAIHTAKKKIGVIFGSRSVEHDVSIVTATQVMKALDPQKYEIIPIYISREGQWYTGKNLQELKNFRFDDIDDLAGIQPTHLSPHTDFAGLITPPVAGRLGKNKFTKLDVVFPAVHGSHGEDGTLQGLLELANVPCVGMGVLASAVANDKAMTKVVLSASGIPVLPSINFTRKAWLNPEKREDILSRIENTPGFPVFVKPATLGSSIGVARASTREDVIMSIDIAANFDRLILVDKALTGENVVEINCALLGNETVRASALEQPISYQEFLSFQEKYMREGGQGMKSQERIIPAPLSEELTAKIQETAIEAFKVIRGRGTARIDFLLDKNSGEFYVNEINTMPGSLAFYLWEPAGKTARQICDELIQLALEEHAEKQRNTYNYKTGLVGLASRRGAKGIKSGKALS